jgi:L-aspartate oxidase
VIAGGGLKHMDTDVLVVGAGIAGLCTALAAAPRRVTLLFPDHGGTSSSSAMAQGGLAAALAPGDSLAAHVADTLTAACHSADPAAVLGVLGSAAGAVQFLEGQGVRFDRGATGRSLHREAGHSCARVLHAAGDRSGEAIVAALAERAREAAHIEFLEGWRALRLGTIPRRGVAGVLAAHRDGRHALLAARETVLATGGLGQLFAYTTNGPYATGDGLAMALAAGARVAALEFVQFHPTALRVAADPLPLLTEALRGAGARLVTTHGRELMAGRHPLGDLAPRDVAARVVWEAAQSGEDVRLDARAVFSSAAAEDFPGALRSARLHGIEPACTPLPATAAAHYHMGGVVVDRQGRSSIPGLWACGEVAHTGMHGANRLASNSLLEAVVCGRGLGAQLHQQQGPRPSSSVACKLEWATEAEPAPDATSATGQHALRALMWESMGPVREGATLATALQRLNAMKAQLPAQALVMRQRLALAAAMVEAALRRRESRGAHWRRDYPERDPACDGPAAVQPWRSGTA